MRDSGDAASPASQGRGDGVLAAGVATLMMDAAKQLARDQGITALGITVGLLDEHGPAQRLYGRRGYIPDGWGCVTPWPLGQGQGPGGGLCRPLAGTRFGCSCTFSRRLGRQADHAGRIGPGLASSGCRYPLCCRPPLQPGRLGGVFRRPGDHWGVACHRGAVPDSR